MIHIYDGSLLSMHLMKQVSHGRTILNWLGAAQLRRAIICSMGLGRSIPSMEVAPGAHFLSPIG